MAMFTTIAAGIGLAATAGTTAMSFAQAKKQRKAMREAEKAADTAMQEARKKLEVNVYDKLAIQKEPYELQREAMLSQGAQAIQAGVESERGAAATAGRIQMAQQEGQAGIRSAMGQELMGLEQLSAQEEGRLRDIGVQLDLEEVAGAQLAAANAQELAANATAQGMEGLTSLGSQLAEQAPLFEKSASAKQIRGMERAAKRNDISGADLQNQIASLGGDFSKVAGMSRPDFLDYMRGIDARKIKDARTELGLGGRGQNFKDVASSALRQGRVASVQAAQSMQPTIDRLKQGKANMFLKDLINYDFLNPFRP
ncbi:MAG: hypothetical protein ACO21I_06150 [Candidatus Nanopelagicaceae bacterium]